MEAGSSSGRSSTRLAMAIMSERARQTTRARENERAREMGGRSGIKTSDQDAVAHMGASARPCSVCGLRPVGHDDVSKDVPVTIPLTKTTIFILL